MSIGTAPPEALPNTLPFEMVMDPHGIGGQPVEPEHLGVNELWHGVQSVTVPESRIIVGTPDGVVIATTLRGRDLFIPVPAGMVVQPQGYDPSRDVRSRTGNPADNDGLFLYPAHYVTPEGTLAPVEPDPQTGWSDGPSAIAFREAARRDSIGSIFYGDKKPLRVAARPTVLDGAQRIPVSYETPEMPDEQRIVSVILEEPERVDGDMEFTEADQAELRRLLGESPLEIVGKTAVAEVTELEFAQNLTAGESTREIRMTLTAPTPPLAPAVEPRSRWAALSEIVTERQEGLDLDAISMTHRAAKGLSGDHSNEERLTHQPSVVVHERRTPQEAAAQELPQRTPQQATPEAIPAPSTRELTRNRHRGFSRIGAGVAALASVLLPGRMGDEHVGKRRRTSAGRHAA